MPVLRSFAFRIACAACMLALLWALLWTMIPALGDAQAQTSPASMPFAAALLGKSATTAETNADAPPPSPATIRCNLHHFGDCLDAIGETANRALVNLLTRIPLLVMAVVVLLLANAISKFVGKRLHLLRIRSQNPFMSDLVRMIVRTAIMLVGVLIALDILGWTAVVGAVLGSAGVVGLVLGFAFRDIVENYIAGVLLSVRRPFEPGDHIAIDTREGKVIAVNSRATVLITMDGCQLQLPNSVVFKSVVLNYSRNPLRRFDFTIPIDGKESIREAQTLAIAAIAQIEGLLEDPAPSWTVVDFGTTGTLLRFYGWVNQRDTDLGKVRSEAIRRVKAAFAAADIESPRTVYHIVASRNRDADVFDAVDEPHNGADTSVNREMDAQVAEAIQANPTANLLNPERPVQKP